jgi:hypothetical protein
MRKDFNTTLQIINATGTLSSPDGLKLDILFDLIEMEDIDGDTTGRKFSYGNLRFRDRLESSIVALFLSKTRLTLAGGGIEADVRLYSLNSFTVTGAIVGCGPGDKVVGANLPNSGTKWFKVPLGFDSLSRA